jgi:N-acyl-D-aspartate/D-glutamate deacylase
MMSAIFPPWALEGGVGGLLDRLRDPESRERVREAIEHDTPEWPPWVDGGWPHNLVGAVGWDGIRVASVGADGPSGWVGRSLTDVAGEIGREPFDVVSDLMLDQDGRVGQLVDEISGRDDRIDALLGIMAHPSAAIVSDAEDYGRGRPHPAHAGAFARALRLSRERALMSLTEMVRRMTSRPATLIGLPGRGTIAPGAAADVVLFDPDTVTDRADWDHPRAHASGVHTVVINGVVVVDAGRFVGGLRGEVLRRAP